MRASGGTRERLSRKGKAEDVEGGAESEGAAAKKQCLGADHRDHRARGGAGQVRVTGVQSMWLGVATEDARAGLAAGPHDAGGVLAWHSGGGLVRAGACAGAEAVPMAGGGGGEWEGAAGFQSGSRVRVRLDMDEGRLEMARDGVPAVKVPRPCPPARRWPRRKSRAGGRARRAGFRPARCAATVRGDGAARWRGGCARRDALHAATRRCGGR